MRTSQNIKDRYVITAGVSAYNANFPLYEDTDVAVYLSRDGGRTETLLTKGTQYTVSIAANNQSGTVTLKTAANAKTGDILLLMSDLDYTQELNLHNVTAIDTNATETQLDRDCQQRQQLAYQVGRSVKIPATSLESPEEYTDDFIRAHDETIAALEEIKTIWHNVSTEDTTYRKRIVAELVIHFEDYDAALAACELPVGITQWIYPQGIAYDEDGNFYVLYARGSTETYSAVVKYSPEYEYVGYSLIDRSMESLVLKKESGTLYLYARNDDLDKLYKYSLALATWDGDVLSGTDVGIGNVWYDFAYESGKWYVLLTSTALGNVSYRTSYNVYDDAFNLIGNVRLPITLVGWHTGVSTYRPHVPKMEGFTVRNGRFCISYGAARSVPSGPQTMSTDYGVSEVSTDGTLLKYGVVDSQKLAEWLIAQGYLVERTENEGITVHPQSKALHSLLILTGSETASPDRKMLVIEEFSTSGMDFSDIQSRYTPFEVQYYARTFPRGAGYEGATWYNDLFDPITHERITTFAGILDFMNATEMPVTNFYAKRQSGAGLTYLTGMTVPQESQVVVYNSSNTTFIVQVIDKTSTTTYLINNGGPGDTWQVVT